MTTCLSGGCRRSSTLVTQSGGLSYDTLSASPVIYGAQRIWDWCLAMVASNFYILYSQQLCWRFVCEGQSCLSQCEEIFSRGHKIILKLRISFYLSCSFCDILGVKNILFSPVSLPPPPLFFFFTSCVSVCMCFHWFLYACKCWNFTTIFPSVSPLNCRCLWSLFNICCSWFTQIPKSTETALHQSKMTAPEILGGWCKNNVHRHPMFFWFGVWQNLKYLIH